MVAKRGLGPAFANLFTANLASSLGDGIERLTDDPLLISGIAALAIALFVLVATDGLTIWWPYLVIFVYGAFETVYDGAIRAVVPSIVERSNLSRANARIEGGELLVQNFLSGPFTSVLFAVSALIPLGVNAAVFGGALALAFFLPKAASGGQFARPVPEAGTPGDRADGRHHDHPHRGGDLRDRRGADDCGGGGRHGPHLRGDHRVEYPHHVAAAERDPRAPARPN
ncbi:MFS transporter [Marisediminicola antarctica]|uniref:MFS transporter n=1 Tax=Marisediminicola antarctica TaxID=674079 RepID=A0A7L5AFJ2_9MICO|nr:MFS transporter [Marisediminicola antarctica]QHO69240.1 hypothetical protein BHD05_05850 [Marisediminicola antarctica]